MFQMQIYNIFVLLLYSGAVSGGLEKVLRQVQFIADIYRQFPHSCIFNINPETQQQGEDWFCIIYSSCLLKCTEMCWQNLGMGCAYVFLNLAMMLLAIQIVLVDGKALCLRNYILFYFVPSVVVLSRFHCSQFVFGFV
jgi:hypothetical protein